MDERLREIERDAATGDEDAESRRLIERLRGGELRVAHLELLAHLGHPPARRVLGSSSAPPGTDEEPWLYVAQLSRWGLPVAGRACLAVIRPLLRGYELDRPGDTSARQLLEAGERWCDCPCDEHRDQLLEAFHDIPAFETIVAMTLGPFQFLGAAGRMVSGMEWGRLERLRRSVEEAVGCGVIDPHQLIRAELIPWALTGPATIEAAEETA